MTFTEMIEEEQEGERYHRIDPATIDTSHMEPVIDAQHSRSVLAALVPFPFVIQTSDGHDHEMDADSLILLHPDTHELYVAPATSYKDVKNPRIRKKLEQAQAQQQQKEYFQKLIAADRSPIAGIQFNNVDTARAFDRIGKHHLAMKLDPHGNHGH